MYARVSDEALTQNRMERIKYERDGLDVLRDIYRWAREGFEAIGPDDLERLKWYGLFHRNKVPGYFMLRLRVPNGILRAHQIRAIAEIANEYGRGRADLTTRQGIQMRWITIEQVPDLFNCLYGAGISALQTGLDNVRNVVGCPLAGIDHEEILDASGIVQELNRVIVGNRAYSNLPRKFNISITGCREDCGHAHISDIGLTPAVRRGPDGPVPGFNVVVGGALGGQYQALARDLDLFVRPEEVVEVCRLIMEVFRNHGPREQRTRARLKFLLDDWGVERFRAELERRAGRPFERGGDQSFLHRRRSHLGIHRQKQAGLCFLGLHVPVGRATGDQLLELARLAEDYGTGEIRLTPDQNIILPHVPEERVSDLLREDLMRIFRPAPSPIMRGLVACTGAEEFCNFAVIATKTPALEIARELEGFLGSGRSLRIHWSGCPNSCGQHHIADIGLEGTKAKVDGRMVDAVNVYWGGRYGPDGRLAEKVLERIPVCQLAQVLKERLGESRRPATG